MMFKKGVIFIFLILCFLSIAGVCASGTGEVDIQTGNGTLEDVIASQEVDIQDNNDVIASDEVNSQDIAAASDENDLLTAPHSFGELQGLIDNTHESGELNLTSDYSIAYGGGTIVIKKAININGNGHTLDGGNLKRIFDIEVNNVNITLKDIKFKNGGEYNILLGIRTDSGGAIFSPNKNTKLRIINCDFRHNMAVELGGAICSEGPLEIIDSHFQRNVVRFGNGGAIFCNDTLFINNTDFTGNEVQENYNPAYLHIKKSFINILSDRYYFLGEHSLTSELFNKVFEFFSNLWGHTVSKNSFPMTGGAVFCKKDCTVLNSNFQGNIVGTNYEQIATSGGAIHCVGNIVINNTHFDGNKANDWGGGAIFIEGNCTVYNSLFEDNTADKGCAIYCWGETRVYNSEFSHNRHDEGTTWMESWGALKTLLSLIDEIHLMDMIDLPIPIINFFKSEGGAIWSQGNCYIESCEFDGNYASEHGGAIYAKDNLTVTGENIFHNNNCYGLSLRVSVYERDGGAIYSKGNLNLDNSIFYNNAAFTDGGAIYCQKEATITNSAFTSNLATYKGGAIFANAKLTTVNCNFTENVITITSSGGAIYNTEELIVKHCIFSNNSAISAGAILCEKQSTITDSIFVGNSAYTDGTIFDKSYGGAIRAKKLLTLTNCNFTGNTVEYYGGAIFADDNIIVTGCRFDENTAGIDGGAIFCEKISTITDSLFNANKALGKKFAFRSFGGAIRSKKLITVTDCVFENNTAHDWGGAVYADDEIRLLNHNEFIGNSAKEAGAVYTSVIKQPVSMFSSFVNNHATDGSGGAIHIYNHCDPIFSSCVFRQNTCTKNGGAVYLAGYTGTLKVSDCRFESNTAGQHGGAVYTNYFGVSHTKSDISNSHFLDNTAKEGGAVYTSEIIQVSKSEFLRNKATSGGGGAVYVNNKCGPKFSSCTFEHNTCTKNGGAVYLDGYGDYLTLSDSTFNENSAGGNGGATYANYIAGSTYSKTEINRCTFTSNSAKEGGAVFTCEIPKTVSKSTFVGNKATGGSGGAVYINNKCNPEFVSCRFEQNNAYDTGGAIYLDSSSSHLKVSYCTFVDNHADKKKYNGPKRHASGHSIFNKGHYDLLDMCWMGKNNPDKKDFDQQFVKCVAGGNDQDNTPANTLRIAIKLNETQVFANNNYKAIIYFQGSNLNKDILHSTGSFYGDGQFSNIKAAGPNDMTADVNFTDGSHKIYGKLDNQAVSLSTDALSKKPNALKITSCIGNTYPYGVKVTFTTPHGLFEGAKYIIKDADGNFVKEGKLNVNYRMLVVEALRAGSYSITLINPESQEYLESSDNATFTISKGTPYVDVGFYEVTYPHSMEFYLYGTTYIPWNLTITNVSGVVYSTTVVIDDYTYIMDPDDPYNAYFPVSVGVLDIGEYEISLSFEEDARYTSFSVTKIFRVHSDGTAFEINVHPQEITYGETATVTHVLPENATGSIAYYLIDGTFLGEASVSENFKLPVLDAGSYIIVANYSGDANRSSQRDFAHVLVKKADVAFEIGNVTCYQGRNETVTHTLSYGANGTIIYYLLDGTILGEFPVNESLVLPVWNVGTYVILANYSGDRNFMKANANATLTILGSEKTEIIAMPLITTYKDDDYLLIELIDVNGDAIAGANMTVDLNGVKNYITDENGQIKVYTSNLGANTYDVYIGFEGMGKYANCSTVTQIFVSQRPSHMVVSPLTTIYQVHKYLMVNLKDDNGNPISGVEVFTEIHGVVYRAITDSNGDGRLIIRLNPMDYVAAIVFDSDNYTVSLEHTKVVVYKADPSMQAKNKKFKANKKVKRYSITLKDNVGKVIKDAKVTLKIKGKTYVAKTNSNGIAVFKIKKLTKKGRFTATVAFEGNMFFNAVTKKVKITCSK